MKFKTLFLSLIFCLCSPLFANNTVYTIKIESVSKNTTTTHQDIEQAFHQLTLELTHKEALPIPPYDNITPIIEQYQYVEENSKLFLVIDFDKKATTQYLSKNNLTLSLPPSENFLLLYVAQKVDLKEELLDIETHTTLINTITQAALEKGFTLISPAFDLNDIEEIQFKDIWQNNRSKLNASIKRYQTQGALTVKLWRNEGDDWHADWDLYQSNKHYRTSNDSAPIRELTEKALQQITEQPKMIEPIKQDIIIEAAHFNSEEKYQKMFNEIKNEPGVLTVQIDRVTPDSVFYKLSINTEKNVLINKLKGHKNFDTFKVTP